MNRNLADQILGQYAIVDELVDPPDDAPDSVANAIYERHDHERAKLDALCMMALRQMVIDDARRALNMTTVHARE